MHTYTVTKWSSGPSPSITVEAKVKANNHREALEASGLKESGAIISVNGLAELNIRYQVDSLGRVTKLAHYGSVE